MKRMGPKFQRTMDAAAIAIFAAAVICICAGILSLVGCTAVCPALDLASQTCPAVVKFVDEQGQPKQMVMTQDDARELAAKKAAARDAGSAR